MKLLILIAVLLLASKPVVAQLRQPSIKYLDAETFGVNDGLSQGLVNCITQDRFGFMWLGTLDGLNRYDGYTVTTYRHDPDDSGSVADNFITAIFEDSKGRLWVGTNTSGLDLFNYETERFIHFRHSTNQNNSITDDHIISVQEDANGALWVGTKNGLNKIIISEKAGNRPPKMKQAVSSFFDSHHTTIKHIQFDTSGKELFTSHETTNTSASFVPSFFIDLGGLVFVRTEYDYFCIRSSLNRPDTIVKLPGLWYDPKEKEKISAIISITGSAYDNEEFLFLMAMKYVAEIDAHTGIVNLTKHLTPDIMQQHNATPFIDEHLWFVHHFHLYQYTVANQQVNEIKSYEAHDALYIAHSTAIYKDRTGKVWVGTGGYGIVKFNTANEKFHRVKSQSVHWLYSNASDNVIIKEEDSTYLLQKNINGSGGLTWKKNSDPFKNIYALLNGKYLRATVQQTDGTIWMQAGRISKYDPSKKTIETFKTNPASWSALYLGNDNEPWFADDTMLCKISALSAKEMKYPIPFKSKSPDLYVSTIFKDSQHIVWVGTTDGLFRFDEKQQKWNQYAFRSNDLTSLSSNHVLSICANANSRYLWIGTNGGGFDRFDKETGKCDRYSTHDGLSNNVVYGILTDESGELWMSTNNGISDFDPVTKRFDNYTVEDGLQGNEFNRYAYCKAKDGTMFFGGVYGYNYFHPKEINTNQLLPKVILTDFKSNGHSIDFREKDSPLSMPPYLTKKIVLNFINNTISFDFSAMYFKASTHDKYQYMLQGVDKVWVSSSTNHSAVYSNLHPGSYIFKVKTGNLNKDYTSVDIIILPPWYMTWWFIILLVICFTALVYSFYRYNLKNEINRFKDHQRIASDLHDEIGSTLSSIHIYSEVALSKINSKPLETETYLKQISNNVENTIGSLDDIVWALNAKNDRFEDIGNRMRAAAVSICEASGYTLHLHFDEQLNELKFGKEIRKNLFLIYKEAINNVMKYADGKNLYVDLSSIKNVIVLSIRDDGKGFDEKEKSLGNGLGNMQKRAKDLNGKLEIISLTGKGTSIILKFYGITGG